MTVRPRRSPFTQSQCILKPLWKCISLVGMRRCFRWVQIVNPRSYADTISHFNPPLLKGQQPVIALTIDDGLSRGGTTTSMADNVFQLLAQYQAHATFFVCTDYLKDQDDSIRTLLQEGHELGNHLQADRLWYYPKLNEEAFRDELQGANRILDDLEARLGGNADYLGGVVQNNDNPPKARKTRWFRAPQGLMNAKMNKIVAEDASIQHVLGDCYCDDWSFARDADPLFVDDDDDDDHGVDTRANSDSHQDEPDERISLQQQQLQTERVAAMRQVATIMLKQVRVGSVAILHMPEKGFRQGGLLALEFFLQGIQSKGWKCVNLTEMEQLCRLGEEEE